MGIEVSTPQVKCQHSAVILLSSVVMDNCFRFSSVMFPHLYNQISAKTDLKTE